MRGQHLFFATRQDLVPGLEYIEGRWELEYHPHEMRSDTGFLFLESLLLDELLGVSASGSTSPSRDYFVYPRQARPRPRVVPQRRGGVRYVLDASPDTVHLNPGGLHAESGALIAGRVARAVAANARGDSLYREFSQAILRGFHRVRLYWVGPEAYEWFEAGRRLATIGIRSPREYDLSKSAQRV